MTRKQTPLWLVKTRCAAVGAAVAVTFGLGGLDFASATIATGGRNVFVPVVPCRLFDTRPAPSTVGGRSTPILKDEQFEVPVRGSQGNCHVSAGATAVVLNVTAADAKGDGFLTVWPAENPLPIASNLNFSDGQAPVANAVTVKIDSQGAIMFASSARSLNVIADVVGYFEDHNHADAYKPKSTVLGTTVVPTAPSTTLPPTTLPPTTLPPTTAPPTTAPPTYDVPNTGNAITNGNNLRAFLVGKSNRAVTLAPAPYNIGATPLTVPQGVVLQGVTQYTTDIIGNSPLTSGGVAQFLPIVILSADATLIGIGVSGSGGGAGVQANTVPGATARITKVIIDVSATNGSVFNGGSGNLVMTNVKTRSGFGVNNGSTNGPETGTILIQGLSDIDGVVQNATGGSISVKDSYIGLGTASPISGVTAYKGGQILLTNVTVYSAVVGIWAVNGPVPGPASRIDVTGGSILSQFPVQASSAGTTLCTNVAKPAGGFFSSNCT
jgi:hypothetical protein